MQNTLQNHYTKTARVERLMTVDSSDKQEFATHIESLPCHVQPFTDSFTGDIEGGFGKEFLMFCNVADIEQGDRVIIDDEEYRVMSEETFQFRRMDKHMELRIRIFN